MPKRSVHRAPMSLLTVAQFGPNAMTSMEWAGFSTSKLRRPQDTADVRNGLPPSWHDFRLKIGCSTRPLIRRVVAACRRGVIPPVQPSHGKQADRGEQRVNPRSRFREDLEELDGSEYNSDEPPVEHRDLPRARVRHRP